MLPYLAAAGVGRLMIVDHDRVEESNLHRQPLFRMGDLGRDSRSQAAREALLATEPAGAHRGASRAAHCRQRRRAGRGVRDVVVDAADSLAVTYVLSDACQRCRHAAGERLGARACRLRRASSAAVHPAIARCFPRCRAPPAPAREAGVLGTAVGVIGTLQAHLTLALLLKLAAERRSVA